MWPIFLCFKIYGKICVNILGVKFFENHYFVKIKNFGDQNLWGSTCLMIFKNWETKLVWVKIFGELNFLGQIIFLDGFNICGGGKCLLILVLSFTIYQGCFFEIFQYS